MASLKEIKARINSVQSTRKITSAMKMVASAKLHKTQNLILNMYPYQQQMNKILRNFLKADCKLDSPYLEQRAVKRIAVVAFSSNSSLCGAFNANAVKLLQKTLDEYQADPSLEVSLYPVGKKVEEAAKKLHTYPIMGTYQSLADHPSYAEAAALATHLMTLYRDKQIDRVELLYHHFQSTGVQVLKREVLLPVSADDLMKQVAADDTQSDSSKAVVDYIVEPSVEEFLADLLPKVVCQKMYTVAFDSSASEHAARMLAMQTATENAESLLQELKLQYNKGRQQAITNEMLDIIGGSLS